MGKLEDEVRRDIEGTTPKLAKVSIAGSVNLEGLDDDERFRMLLSRLENTQSAVIRLAQHIDKELG
jgi:ribosome assembly protein YihI (activator of Der GTPase)